jgi:hypothetical protein
MLIDPVVDLTPEPDEEGVVPRIETAEAARSREVIAVVLEAETDLVADLLVDTLTRGDEGAGANEAELATIVDVRVEEVRRAGREAEVDTAARRRRRRREFELVGGLTVR